MNKIQEKTITVVSIPSEIRRRMLLYLGLIQGKLNHSHSLPICNMEIPKDDMIEIKNYIVKLQEMVNNDNT